VRNSERCGLCFLAAALTLPWLWEGVVASPSRHPDPGVSSAVSGEDRSSRSEPGAGSGGLDSEAAATAITVAQSLLGDLLGSGGLAGDAAELRRLAEQAALRGAGDAEDAESTADATGVFARVDYSYSNRQPDFRLRPPGDFDSRDLAVLQEIIELNGLGEDSSETDFDNGDGQLDALEIGDQRWCNGRLVELRMGPDFYSSFGYRIQQLPESIGELEGLMVLEANSGDLQSLPRSLANLPDLRRLSFYDNAIREIPAELALSPSLQEIQLTANPVSEVPRELALNPSLSAVFVDSGLPVALQRPQGEALPPRNLGPLGQNCQPTS